ncbi:TetR/AcrR family transcriptional regulator [Sphingopyxis alaskensis]|uniref:TetR/AcrR family transcriptional regulator n=1 Tax=Sphingopyxis alaskensis TaxID=117207 RepID=UPI0002E9F21F|nr:TetR family transcriptional regulator [Sphingopyxis alaskensis]MCM3420408.1 TetR/AcrR family transcriptional regulator [Sphingopyxis alaskensis]
MGRRAKSRDLTRQRIVDAAIELHSSVGPARTTVAQIAERAGVQRHTYYAHFPDEWDLLLACSGTALGRDPLPDPARLGALPKGPTRLREGLSQFYDWFARNEGQAGCVLRDAEYHDPTRHIVALRMAPVFAAAASVMGEDLGRRATALLGVALDFSCWRALAGSCSPDEAAALMADAIMLIDG